MMESSLDGEGSPEPREWRLHARRNEADGAGRRAAQRRRGTACYTLAFMPFREPKVRPAHFGAIMADDRFRHAPAQARPARQPRRSWLRRHDPGAGAKPTADPRRP